MKGDEYLGQAIIMKGKPSNYKDLLATVMNRVKDLGEDIIMIGYYRDLLVNLVNLMNGID